MYADADLVEHWEGVLQSYGLGLYQGMRLGVYKILYIPHYRDSDRPFYYSVFEKTWDRKRRKDWKGAEHLRIRERLKKRRWRAARTT
jgi:hypothetical protein